jgi:hypothetical protein
MKCSNPDCNRGIGLVAYRRGWFSKWRYCSKYRRDAFVANAPNLQQKWSVAAYFEWLFLQPIEDPQLKLKPAACNKNGDRIVYVRSTQRPPLPDRCMAHSLLPE